MAELLERIRAYTESGMSPYHMPGHKRAVDRLDQLDPMLRELYRCDLTEVPGTGDLHAADEETWVRVSGAASPEQGDDVRVSGTAALERGDDVHVAGAETAAERGDDMLVRSQARAARLYGAYRTYYLINGSTAGVLTVLSAAVPRGAEVLMQRASHRSAYHGAELRDLRLHYLYGERTAEGICCGVRLEEVAAAMEHHPETQAVFLTSPGYEGYSSDVAEIAAYLHERGVALIVDAAHGAHYGLDEELPPSAVQAGADYVVMSLHKMLPAPTQTALLHLGQETTPAQIERVRHFYSIYQSSSPSYPLMAAMDDCIARVSAWGEAGMGDGGGKASIWQQWYGRREALSRSLQGLSSIRVIDAYSGEARGQGCDTEAPGRERALPRPDPCKLLLLPRDGRSGLRMAEALRSRYHIQVEMALPQYLLLICTPMDSEEEYQRLAKALRAMDDDAEQWHQQDEGDGAGAPGGAAADGTKTRASEGALADGTEARASEAAAAGQRPYSEMQAAAPETVCRISEAVERPATWIALDEAAGRISAGYCSVYPPGQPFLVPGERITAECVRQIRGLQQQGCTVQGLTERGELRVLEDG